MREGTSTIPVEMMVPVSVSVLMKEILYLELVVEISEFFNLKKAILRNPSLVRFLTVSPIS